MTSAGEVAIRPIEPDEYIEWRNHMPRAFGDTPDEARSERERELIHLPDTLGAFDGSEVVGIAHHEPSQITLPGGARLDCAGVTRVSVAPTHRRRGILRAMMARQLADIASRGTPLAALWASESSIYGRFGYGLGTVHEHWRIELNPSRPTARSPGRLPTSVDCNDDPRTASGSACSIFPPHSERGPTRARGASWSPSMIRFSPKRAGASCWMPPAEKPR